MNDSAGLCYTVRCQKPHGNTGRFCAIPNARRWRNDRSELRPPEPRRPRQTRKKAGTGHPEGRRSDGKRYQAERPRCYNQSGHRRVRHQIRRGNSSRQSGQGRRQDSRRGQDPRREREEPTPHIQGPPPYTATLFYDTEDTTAPEGLLRQGGDLQRTKEEADRQSKIRYAGIPCPPEAGNSSTVPAHGPGENARVRNSHNEHPADDREQNGGGGHQEEDGRPVHHAPAAQYKSPYQRREPRVASARRGPPATSAGYKKIASSAERKRPSARSRIDT